MTTTTYQILNYTPHAVTILREDGSVHCRLPSDGVARVSEITTSSVLPWDRFGDGAVDLVPLVTRSLGEVVGLPDPRAGVMYIVSIMVQQGLPHRADLLVPHDLVRDAGGQPLGCRGFSIPAARPDADRLVSEPWPDTTVGHPTLRALSELEMLDFGAWLDKGEYKPRDGGRLGVDVGNAIRLGPSADPALWGRVSATARRHQGRWSGRPSRS